MKLTGKLKDKVDAAESKEEKKDIIAEAGMELTDEELEGVAGGYFRRHADNAGRIRCFKCNSPDITYMATTAVCNNCGAKYKIFSTKIGYEYIGK